MLVMRNALLIPTVNHYLIPPFLLREAGLYVDEILKHQVALPTIDNHVIVDLETGMWIHLSLEWYLFVLSYMHADIGGDGILGTLPYPLHNPQW